MASGSAQVDQVLELRQIECAHDAIRCQLPGAVHAGEKTAHRYRIAEVMIEQRGAVAEDLRPAIRAFAHRVIEPTPERIERTVRMENVADKGIRAGGYQRE